MIRISEAVYNIIKAKPYLEYALYKELINTSALAREIRPEVEAMCLKNVTTSAIVMALKRLQPDIDFQFATTNISGKLNNAIVRSGLSGFTYSNSSSLAGKVAQLVSLYHDAPHSFIISTRGSFETSIVITTNLADDVKHVLQGENLIKQIDSLSGIIIKLDKTVLHNPGSYYEITKALAWEGINVIELFSTYRELVIIIESAVIDDAFRVLKNYFLT